MTSFIRCSLISIGLAALSTSPARAAVLAFTTQASWSANVAASTTVDFDSISTGSYNPLIVGPALNQINLSVVGDVMFVAPGSNYANNDNTHVLASNANFGVLHAAVQATNVTAFAANLFPGFPGNHSMTVNVYLVGAPTVIAFTQTVTTASNGTPAFLGVTSDVAIDHVDFVTTASDGPVVLDNLQWGQGSAPDVPTPESTSLAYMALGISAMYFGLRHRNRHDFA
jgi:hypothetical protein